MKHKLPTLINNIECGPDKLCFIGLSQNCKIVDCSFTTSKGKIWEYINCAVTKNDLMTIKIGY